MTPNERTTTARLHFISIDGPARLRYGNLTERTEPLFEAVPGWREALTAYQAAIEVEDAEYHAERRRREAERRRLEGGDVGRRVWVLNAGGVG